MAEDQFRFDRPAPSLPASLTRLLTEPNVVIDLTPGDDPVRDRFDSRARRVALGFVVTAVFALSVTLTTPLMP